MASDEPVATAATEITYGTSDPRTQPTDTFATEQTTTAAGQPSGDLAAEIAYGGGRSENIRVPAASIPYEGTDCTPAEAVEAVKAARAATAALHCPDCGAKKVPHWCHARRVLCVLLPSRRVDNHGTIEGSRCANTPTPIRPPIEEANGHG